jgi:hypothetical protein
MKNFKEETILDIISSGHTAEDVAWIGSEEVEVNNFWDICDFDYDDGYGSAEIARDLVIVFKDGSFLERREYDGSEWWAFNCTPKKPNFSLKFKKLRSCEWPKTLYELIDET